MIPCKVLLLSEFLMTERNRAFHYQVELFDYDMSNSMRSLNQLGVFPFFKQPEIVMSVLSDSTMLILRDLNSKSDPLIPRVLIESSHFYAIFFFEDRFKNWFFFSFSLNRIINRILMKGSSKHHSLKSHQRTFFFFGKTAL